MNFPLDPTDGWAARVFFFFFQVGLLNVDGYYNSLLTFIDKAVEEGFINPSARRIIVLAPTAQELMDKLEVRHGFFFSFLADEFAGVLTYRVFAQEYVPYHDRVASTLNWEMGHLGY